jgi:protein-disulfide isomerase
VRPCARIRVPRTGAACDLDTSNEEISMKPFSIMAASAVAVAIGASGCADPREVEEMKATVDEIQATQKEIVTKLEELSKGQKAILAKAPTAAKPSRPQEDPDKVYKVNVGTTYGNTKGPDDAAVTIVEFSDFQCPFCSQAAGLVKQIVEAYPDDVRVVYKNYPLPFHKQALPAAKAAVAAGKQGKFWEMHDKLFENYRTLNDDVYATYASEIGIDVEKFKSDMASDEVKKIVDQDMSDARTAEVRGTPTFFINGKKPQGRSFELYKGLIEAQLKDKG